MTSMDHSSLTATSEEAEDEISLLDLALVAAENLRMLVLGPLLVGVSALGISFLVPPTFTAKAVMMPPQQQQSSAAAALQSLGALAGLAGGAAGIKSPADQYVALMQSTTVEDRLIDQFKLMQVYDEKWRSDTRKELERNTRISSGKKDGLITIEVDDHDPQRAAALANAYIEELRLVSTKLAMTEAQQRRMFFEKQLGQTKERFTAAQQALQASGINEGAIRAEPKAAAEAYARLRAEVTAAEVRLQAMRSYLTEAAPEFQLAQTQLVALRAQMAKAESSNSAAAQGDYISRFREFKYQEALFELFAKQYELARVDESREGALIQVVDPATPPERKSKPKKALIAVVATLATGFALLLWVFVRHALRNARRSADSAQKLGMLSAALRRSVGRRA
jgi:tyrosine-protein kinase Etk/Wzc